MILKEVKNKHDIQRPGFLSEENNFDQTNYNF